jgi:hypothetical protein
MAIDERAVYNPDAGDYDRLALLAELEQDYAWWLWRLFPQYFTADNGSVVPMADHHHEAWEWFWDMPDNARPQPLVLLLPRGGGKSTTVELGCVSLGCRAKRKYVLYVSGTQEQADDHVLSMAGMLESRRLELAYPDMSRRLVGKYGSSRGWRRDRLRTMTGFTVDALGLDTASRGVKLEDQRPDVIVFDDIDSDGDTDKEVRKKVRIITRRLLPAATQGGTAAIIFAQNLVHERSIASLLCGKHPDPKGAQIDDFLVDRRVIGPIPAVRNADVRYQNNHFELVAGEPTWEGQSLEVNQALIDTEGYSAWRQERQHNVEPPAGGMFSHLNFDAMCVEQSEVPELIRIVGALDPAVTSNDDSDSMALQFDGLGTDDVIYRLWSWEQRATPNEAMEMGLRRSVLLGADALIIETDQGGDLWLEKAPETWAHLIAKCNGTEVDEGFAPHTEQHECPYLVHITEDTFMPTVTGMKAGATQMPKTHRAALMLQDYERPNKIRHVRSGTEHVLRAALHRFPKTKPFDLTDASYWAWNELTNPSVAPSFLLQAGVIGWNPR